MTQLTPDSDPAARTSSRLRSALGSVAHLKSLGVLAAIVLVPFLVSVTSGPVFLRRLAGLAVICILLVLAGIASRMLFAALCLLLAVSGVVHQHVSRHWGTGQFDSRAEAVFESPPGEIRQYIQAHVDAIDVLFLLGAVIFALALMRTCWRARPAPVPTRGLALLALAAGIGLIAAVVPTKQLKGFPPFEPVWRTAIAKHRYDQLARRRENLHRHPLARRDCSLKYDKIVIVIGESAVTDRMSVFGYGRTTTPFAVSSRAQAFEALAPSNQTRYSVAMMLTRARPGAFDSFFTSHSLVGELRACGYHTVWLSNQGRRGEWDSFVTSLANEADEQVFLNDWSWSRESVDGRIVDEVARRGYAKRGRQATFLHLIGSHTDYEERYPAGFGFGHADTVGEHYDNTILYTDFVLSELYRDFFGHGTLFVYVADHGQIVSESRFGSGFVPGYKEEFRTPLLIWSEDTDSIAVVRRLLDGSRLNLESFDDLVRYLVGMAATPNVSTSTDVSVLSPEIVRDYQRLEALATD